ncbi:MAG TPA: aminoglycoside phosphotransferase family protein [Acidimicrobiia bacterium]
MPKLGDVDAHDRSLLAGLVASSGQHGGWSAVRVSGRTSTNHTYVLHVGGRRFVARCYRWPYEGDDRLERPRKEAWLSQSLAAAGVPVPEIVATVDARDNSGGAVLMRYVEGDLLGELAAARVSGLETAWADAGRALRRAHALPGPPGGAGQIVGDRLEPFREGSWGEWQAANLTQHAARLAARHGSAIPVGDLRRVAEAAVDLLDERPLRLIHNDPHPWNVLAVEARGRWKCAAWLDWEFAWVGDPLWDLARLDVFRVTDIGPTPDAFFEGYGSAPEPPAYEFYVLAINLWMVNQSDDGSTALPATFAAARTYVRDLARHLVRIETMLTA